MPGNVPNVSRDSFDASKLYDKVTLQQGVPIPDSDWNEMNDVLRLAEILSSRICIGSMPLPAETNSSTQGYQVQEAAAPANNFKITGGWFLVEGVLVPTVLAEPPTDHDYEDDTNRIGEGEVTGAAANVLTDLHKNWQVFHDLLATANHGNCRVKMTSGAEAGNTFEITAFTATTLTLTGLPTIAPGDTYIVKPPALTTPVGLRTDLVRVHAWWEDVNKEEDPNLQHPGLGAETAHREQRRWCVRVHENVTGPIPQGPVIGFGPRWAFVAALSRIASPNILAAQINDYLSPLPAGSFLRSLYAFENFAYTSFGRVDLSNTWATGQVFNGDDVFNGNEIFNGTVTFNDPVTFNDTLTTYDAVALDRVAVDLPRLGTAVYDVNFVQIWESQTNAGPNRFLRMYTVGGTGVTGLNGGHAITVNARWDFATSKWVGDDTASTATIQVIGNGSTFTGKKLVTSVPWNTTDWFSTPNPMSVQSEGGFAGRPSDVTTALLTLASDIGVAPQVGQYVLVFAPTDSLAASQGGKSRLYVRDTGTGPEFSIVTNAVWNPTTSEWSGDDVGGDAAKLTFVAGFGGVRWSRGSGGGTWNDTSWPVEINLGLHITNAGDELSYLAPIDRTKIFASKAVSDSDSGVLQYFWDSSDWKWRPAAIAGTALVYELDLPDLSELTKVEVMVFKGNAVAQVSALLLRNTYDFVTPDRTLPVTIIAGATSGAVTGKKKITLTPGGTQVSDDDNRFYVAVVAGHIADAIYGVRVYYKDYGFSGR